MHSTRVFRSPKVFLIFPVVLSLTCGFHEHGSMSLPLHLWPTSPVQKRIPFRLQAVRVVLCCSRLQLSSLLPASLADPISFSAYQQTTVACSLALASPRWAPTPALGSTVVLPCCPHGSRSLLCRTQVLFYSTSGVASAPFPRCHVWGLAVLSGQQGATASPARAAVLPQAYVMPHGAVPQ